MYPFNDIKPPSIPIVLFTTLNLFLHLGMFLVMTVSAVFLNTYQDQEENAPRKTDTETDRDTPGDTLPQNSENCENNNIPDNFPDNTSENSSVNSSENLNVNSSENLQTIPNPKLNFPFNLLPMKIQIIFKRIVLSRLEKIFRTKKSQNFALVYSTIFTIQDIMQIVSMIYITIMLDKDDFMPANFFISYVLSIGQVVLLGLGLVSVLVFAVMNCVKSRNGLIRNVEAEIKVFGFIKAEKFNKVAIYVSLVLMVLMVVSAGGSLIFYESVKLIPE